MQTSIYKSSPDAKKKSDMGISSFSKATYNPFLTNELAEQNPFHDGKNVNPFSPVQMKQAPLQMMEEEEEMQMKQAPMQKKEASSTGVSSSSASIPADVQSSMEQTLGADFSDVNIHQNSSKAPEVGALAYTQGKDIHFAPGEYNPESKEGTELLGHELTHVVQQGQGRVKPTTQVQGVLVNDDAGLEQEADKMGQKAAQMLKK